MGQRLYYYYSLNINDLYKDDHNKDNHRRDDHNKDKHNKDDNTEDNHKKKKKKMTATTIFLWISPEADSVS